MAVIELSQPGILTRGAVVKLPSHPPIFAEWPVSDFQQIVVGDLNRPIPKVKQKV